MTTARDPIGETVPIRSKHRREEARAIDEASGIGRRSDAGLRFAVTAVDRQLSLLLTQEPTAESSGALVAAWAGLLDELALGPAPDVRKCPVCGRLGMSAATLCGFCWTRLSPIAPVASRRD